MCGQAEIGTCFKGSFERKSAGCLDLAGGDAGNRAKLDEINGKSKDEAEGVEQNSQADLGIGMHFTKLIDG
ncbi:hypothetical protein A7E78_04430 [Syntrophotalea acetylenivorans]|uniref:Uncharacterized protein n=1 Tax=Syntrophotalea acetylenivorans TaxID=1842532 RepID=A0A1L3GMI1_9BACT|nr:hypothetical protein A7E78_04430 [Syntrophotalea acetylenivorans]